MDFALSDQERMIADLAGAFFAEQATSERTREAMASGGIDRALWSAFSTELGLCGILIPEDFGGAGLGMVALALVAEAAGAHVAALPLLGQAMTASALVAGAGATRKADLLPRLVSGKLIVAAASGRPSRSKDGQLTGDIRFVPHGAIADLLLILGGDSAWLVDLTQRGVEITPHPTMDGTRPLATISLTKVVAEPLEDGRSACASAEAAGWLCLAAEAVGGAQAALDRTVRYALDRVQFGRPVGSFQAYKHRLADMMVEIEQARSALYWAACAVDELSDEAPLALHSAKAFCADTYRLCAGNMIQLHGGIGFTWEHDAHLFFKRAWSVGSMLGDSAFHREAVAQLVLGAAA